ncbi:hypothetical protein J6590_094856 [Homalodisca vitripennis]|nr:hypothetical protein J6590_094856 [Homalodisca vitripennis]
MASCHDEASLTRHAMYVTLATEPNVDTESNLMNVKKIEKMPAALLAPDLFERGLHTAHCLTISTALRQLSEII